MSDSAVDMDSIQTDHTLLRKYDSDSSRFDIVMAAVVIPLLLMDVILTYPTHLDTLGTLKLVIGTTVGSIGLWVLVAAYWYCSWRGMTKLKDISQLAAWTQLVIPAISFLIPVAGRSPYPLVDSGLARIDARLHFHTVDVVRFVSGFPHLKHSFVLAYAFLPLLVLAALLVPPLTGRVLDARRYVLAVVFASIITAALFALWPAAGPWTVEGFSPRRDQAEVVGALALMKAGMPLPAGAKAGVVAFPSFHVILAVLSAIALWNVRWVRWPAVAFGTAVCVSTITTGWHYGIDVIGGLATTYLVYFLAKLALRPAPAPQDSPLACPDAQIAGTAC